MAEQERAAALNSGDARLGTVTNAATKKEGRLREAPLPSTNDLDSPHSAFPHCAGAEC
jgi:hypothetical protein